MATQNLDRTHLKVVKGYGSGTVYSGKDVLRRAEAAATLKRMGLSRKQALVLSGLLSNVSDVENASFDDRLFDDESI